MNTLEKAMAQLTHSAATMHATALERVVLATKITLTPKALANLREMSGAMCWEGDRDLEMLLRFYDGVKASLSA